MDRISALRNVEEALSAFETGEMEFAATERRVCAVLRTYATEFEDEGRTAYRVSGDDSVDGRIVVAPSVEAARARVADLTPDDTPTFEVRPL